MKLSKIISKLESRGFHKTAKNLKLAVADIMEPKLPEEARELIVYIGNVKILRRRGSSILKNLIKKYKGDVYDHSKAPKLWLHLIDDAAKSYCKEFECTHKLTFPMPIKKKIAVFLANEMLPKIKEGDTKF